MLVLEACSEYSKASWTTDDVYSGINTLALTKHKLHKKSDDSWLALLNVGAAQEKGNDFSLLGNLVSHCVLLSTTSRAGASSSVCSIVIAPVSSFAIMAMGAIVRDVLVSFIAERALPV